MAVKISISCLIFALVYSTSAIASQNKLSSEIGYVGQGNKKLAIGADKNHDIGYIRLSSFNRYNFSDNTQLKFQAKAFYSSDLVSLDPQNSNSLSKKYLELSRLNIQFDHLFDSSFGLNIGLTRFKDPSGAWWDDSIPQISMIIDKSLLTGFVSLGQQFSALRTDSSDYKNKDKDLTRILANLTSQWRYQHFVATNFSFLNDHSGIKNLHADLDQDGYDLRDGKVSWFGINPYGQFELNDKSHLNYSLDYVIQHGNSTEYDKSNLVATNKAVNGWMTHGDISITYALPSPLTVGLQFARTSHSDGQLTEGRFFQTGLHSNRAYLTNNRQHILRYSEAFRPELSNLNIIGMFAGFSWSQDLHTTLLFNKFSRVNDQLAIGRSNISAPLVLDQSALGWTADLAIDYFGLFFVKDRLKFRLSSFTAGAAYGEDIEPRYIRLSLNWKVEF